MKLNFLYSLGIATLFISLGNAETALAQNQVPASPQVESPARGQLIERVIAIVNDDVVLLSEVESVVDDMMRAEPPKTGMDPKEYRKMRRLEVIDTLVAEKLLEQEIRKLRIEVSEPEIERIVEGTKAQHGLDDQKLAQALAQQGLTLKEYKEGLRKQLMKAKIIQLKVKNRVQVTENEVKARAAQNRALNQADFRVKARHILFLVKDEAAAEDARKRAEAAKARIVAGEDFATVAQELSEGPSARNGGSLGVFGRGEMVPEFERAAFSAEPLQVIGPVRTSFGWHLIWVEERVAQEQSESAMEEQIRAQIYEAEVERAFKQYLEELKQAAYIDIRA